MFGKIKLRRTDTLFSLYLRRKRLYLCERCGIFKANGHGLQVSHYHGRRKESVRFDEENCAVACVSCHMFWESHKTEYGQWMVERMGQEAFDLLTLRANLSRKKDDRLIIEWLKLQEGYPWR